MPAAERTIIINTPVSVLYNVITDYEKYPEFCKRFPRLRLLVEPATLSEPKYTVKLIKTNFLCYRSD